MRATINEIPIANRESTLWLASKRYMRGELTLKDFKAVEDDYALHSESFFPIEAADQTALSEEYSVRHHLKTYAMRLKQMLHLK
jgi:hypothetical protein